MSRAHLGRRLLGAGLGLCLALPAAGCSAVGGGGGGGGTSDLGLKKPVTESSAGAVPAGGLAGVALTAGDVDGFTVRVPTADEAAGQQDVQTSEAPCAPVAYALAGTVIGKPSATEVRRAVHAREDTRVTVTLASYDGTAAQAALETLSESVDACAAGFTTTVHGQDWHVTELTRQLAPEGADQAMALGAQVERDGSRASMAAVVLRDEGTVGYVSARGGAGEGSAVPAEVIEAQLRRFG
ncbi:hypothetical protein [Streptomyces sp. NPDC002845]